MFKFGQILVNTLVLGACAASLAACGQQGPLYLPTEPAATRRATLPETLRPFKAAKASAPAETEANPAKQPITPSTQQ
jgi:predicted small lipoprotein YifL